MRIRVATPGLLDCLHQGDCLARSRRPKHNIRGGTRQPGYDDLHCGALLRIPLYQGVEELEVGQAKEGAEAGWFGKKNLSDHAKA